MKIHLKYDINVICKTILQEQLDSLLISYEITGLGEIEIKEAIPSNKYNALISSIKKYGIEIIDDSRNTLVQKIKDIIIEMIYLECELPNLKISAYLSDKLNHRYGYLSSLFSEVTHSSIANFIILQKIERAKQWIVEDNLTLSEISLQLKYSSLAHLSSQFKKITGLTPTAFQRIIKKRKSFISE